MAPSIVAEVRLALELSASSAPTKFIEFGPGPLLAGPCPTSNRACAKEDLFAGLCPVGWGRGRERWAGLTAVHQGCCNSSPASSSSFERGSRIAVGPAEFGRRALSVSSKVAFQPPVSRFATRLCGDLFATRP